MLCLISSRRFLVIYSGCLTLAFVITALCGFGRNSASASFDSLTVHRINVVEPDGTVRLIIANKAEFPGQYLHNREIPRPDRRDSAGVMFFNDEGTEDGGLIYGGQRSEDGTHSSFSHLSFDQYDQDQTVDLGGSLHEGQRSSGLAIQDVPDIPITQGLVEDGVRFKMMPHGAARAAAYAALKREYPSATERGFFGRRPDGSVAVTLSDLQGHVRATLKVKPDGEPVLDFLDQNGRVTREISGTAASVGS
jgi:hypothetical protein